MAVDLERDRTILDICHLIADYYRDLMNKADYDKNGELYNFKETVSYKGSLFELYFVLPDYWRWAEYGRGPGKRPPLDPILKWVRRKGIASTTNGHVDGTTLAAYKIQWKIAKHGTEGSHLLQKTIDDTYNTLVDNLVEAIVDLLDKELEKDIDDINNYYDNTLE